MDAKETQEIQLTVKPASLGELSKEELRDTLSIDQTAVDSNRTGFEQEILFLIPLGFVAIVILLFYFIAVYFRKAVGKRTVNVKRSHKIPCSRCRFFKNNSYLKCAIHPCTVFTSEAINCPDYESE